MNIQSALSVNGNIYFYWNYSETLAQTLSTPNQWAQFQYKCFNENVITLSAVIKSECLMQLNLFLHVKLELGLNSVITSYALLDT